MSARRCFLELALVLSATACRCGDEPLVVPVADGIAIAPFAAPETYLDRAEQLGTRRILIPWTDPGTDLAALREAIRGRDLELIAGLEPARLPEDEWNRPDQPGSGLEAALDRALVLGDELDGVHLDHFDLEPPDPIYLERTVAAIRARTDVPLSYAIRAPDAARAEAWGARLAGRVDRVLVYANDPRAIGELQLLKNRLGDATELWVAVELISATRGAITRAPPARARDEVRAAIDTFRSYATAVFAAGAEHFAPAELLGPDSAPRDPIAAADVNLDARSNDVERRLRRCCIRDGQLLAFYDRRFERDHGANLEQEDACRLTGLYTAAMSFRFAATDDPEAAARAREGFGALHLLANVTPEKGVVVRNFTRAANTRMGWRRAEDRELYWLGDISIDQLAAWFEGMAIFHDLVATDDEKRTIAEDVRAVLELHPGELAFLQIGFHITGDDRYRAEMLRLIDEEGAHLREATEMSYSLIALEHDPARRAELELLFQKFYERRRSFGDAYADMVYGALHPTHDAWRRSIHELRNYRPEYLENAQWIAADLAPAGPFVPIEERPAGVLDFDYQPPGVPELRGGLEHRYSGVGFLLSYWMGRYHGLTTAFF